MTYPTQTRFGRHISEGNHGTDASLMHLSSMVDGYVGLPGHETKNGYVRQCKVLLV